MMEKAMVVLNSLAGIEEGKEAIVEEGGIAALVEAIEDGEGAIPPFVALSQNGTLRAKHKADTLLRYLRESRQEASTSTIKLVTL
ncbi:hypothetical protein P8452_09181 [Trifolium repens]|nr:hypothetical protein P8452_09181 [Trifolium repens]